MNDSDDMRSHVTALIADDDPITRRLLRAFLERMKIKVIEAADGEELLTKFRNTKPAIIITDVQMPKLDGLAAAAEIRKTHSASTLPILAISGWYDEQRINRAAEVGITRCLIKPLQKEEFEDHVTAALNQAADDNVGEDDERDSV